MNPTQKIKEIQEKNSSMICVGLDLDRKKVPGVYANTIKGLFDFTMQIIDATKDVAAAYKPNLAFYEELGAEGFSLLEKIIHKIPDEMVVIADAKLGDIGNTAQHYASAMFDRLKADWVTLNPYMGYDSIRPFIDYQDKGAFILCLTSNTGSRDFQLMHVVNKPIYMYVAEKVAYWNKENNLGLVAGATHPEQLGDIRAAAGDMPILIPGVGAQGGDLEKAVVAGTRNFKAPALINVSRSILYAGNENNFAESARSEVEKLNKAINEIKNRDKTE
ncbi:MAG: orotidine-5'-phosphate decarboxylase [Candidatus Zixiibacteriota bacterium]